MGSVGSPHSCKLLDEDLERLGWVMVQFGFTGLGDHNFAKHVRKRLSVLSMVGAVVKGWAASGWTKHICMILHGTRFIESFFTTLIGSTFRMTTPVQSAMLTDHSQENAISKIQQVEFITITFKLSN